MVLKARLLCEKCKKKCRGDVLRVCDKYFHRGCFTCSKCYKNLETGGFFMKDAAFYCQDDYQKLFVAKCKICAKDLVGEIVTVLNFSFHRDCFKCFTCSVSFNPGDRVTLWNDNFFCPICIRKECVPLERSSPRRKPSENGTAISPLSVTDDEGCISAADVSPTDLTSPRTSIPTVSSKNVKLGTIGSSISQPGDIKCISSLNNPQTSKSILRKACGDDVRVRTSSRERGYWSTDSGLGEKLSDSRVVDDVRNGLHSKEPDHSTDAYPATNMATAVPATSHSRQSLISRVPNSDYGRFYNQSYVHLNEPPAAAATATDRYKRNVAFTTVGNQGKPKHFHLPEAKSRFLPPDVRTHSILFGQSVSNMASQSTSHRSNIVSPRRTLTKQSARSAMELSLKPIALSIPNGLTNGTASSSERVGHQADHDDQAFAVEARRLACFPSGHERDKTVPPPIERFDWPAPPASAVVLAELMRERRFRRREMTRTADGSLGDGVDDLESQEALSIDYSFDGTFGPGDTATAGAASRSSGLAKAILLEEAEQKRRCKSQIIDPVSASRSPNAAIEPGFRPRFLTHQFACQPVRPGYTGGRLSQGAKIASLPTSSLLLNSVAQESNWEPQGVTNGHDHGSTAYRMRSPVNRSYYHSVHAIELPRVTPANPNGLRGTTSQAGIVPNGAASRSGDQQNSASHETGYPNVPYTPTSSSAFYKSAPPAPKSNKPINNSVSHTIN